ncbi:hypothetical protein OPV22_013283 [Ensete ventricosum]|uniref:Uncharacterized protein n=1 Tax=Ensete ventricosum TaxID=4639 RepID=A0AAV8R8X0_ENSVE|nr:hypothetical protein OPV22_013283 [Ensete ventricosum]
MPPPTGLGLRSRYETDLRFGDLDSLSSSTVDRGCALFTHLKVEAEERDCDCDLEGRLDAPKRIKMRDLESVLRVQGTRNRSLDSSTMNEEKVHGHDQKEDSDSGITMASKSVLPDKLASETTGHSSVEDIAACLTLGPAASTSSLSSGHDGLPVSATEFSNESCPIEAKMGSEQSGGKLVGLEVDLNSPSTEHNPFYPFKKLGQIKSADASESGSTTGPVEESGPLRMWKEMKQNGFLSSSHGGIPMPRQRGRQSRKRKEDELRSKTEIAKREQANRFARIAAPSGLLSGLNPGIINHVRNSKQVHSIIEAIVRSEKHDGQSQNRISDQMGRGSKETNGRRKDHIRTQGIPPNMEYTGESNEMEKVRHKFNQRACATSQLTTSERGDDALALKLSSATTMVSENASSATADEFSGNRENPDSLSLEAANVASQWLELLQQDIKGRLAALRRSKKRVRNVIQTELPYLLSKEFMSNRENEPYFAQSSEAGCSSKAISDMHVARWRSLFSQMDRSLFEEGKQLENWLKQIQEMQLHCENGLKFVVSGASSHLISADDSSKPKKSEAVERECAVWAAAASIYSTCNLIMTTENV